MLLVPDESTLTSTSDGLARRVHRAHHRWHPVGVRSAGGAARGARAPRRPRGDDHRVRARVLSPRPGRTPDRRRRLLRRRRERWDQGHAGCCGGSLARHGVAIDSCHAEAGPGQFELDLAAQPPLPAADALSLAKHVVQQCAASIGARASFQRDPLDGAPGSGLHVHQRADTLLDGAGNLTDVGTAFVAGQLRHARGR